MPEDSSDTMTALSGVTVIHLVMSALRVGRAARAETVEMAKQGMTESLELPETAASAVTQALAA
jgi:hypothetical protein